MIILGAAAAGAGGGVGGVAGGQRGRGTGERLRRVLPGRRRARLCRHSGAGCTSELPQPLRVKIQLGFQRRRHGRGRCGHSGPCVGGAALPRGRHGWLTVRGRGKIRMRWWWDNTPARGNRSSGGSKIQSIITELLTAQLLHTKVMLRTRE